MAFIGSIWLDIWLTGAAFFVPSPGWAAPQSQLAHHDLPGLLSKSIIDEFDSSPTNEQFDSIKANDPRCFSNNSF